MSLTKQQIDEYSQYTLFKHYWQLRNTKPKQNSMPEELKTKITEQFENNFKGTYEGPIPYYTLSNMIGINRMITYEDEDGVVFIVSPPGKGKSTIALILCQFIHKDFNTKFVIFFKEQFTAFLEEAAAEFTKEADMRNAGKKYTSYMRGSALLIDEGVYIMFSGDGATKAGKMLTKLFSIIRALGILIIVCATNFRKINKGVKEDRIIGLVHIQRRGIISFHSRKSIRKINITFDSIVWPRPDFTENIGKLKNDCPLWLDYQTKKSEFLGMAIKEQIKQAKTKKKKKDAE